MLNFPNLISFIRILLIPVFIGLIIHRVYHFAFWVFMIAAVSDALDGLLARRLNQRTSLGAYLDPAADKLLSASAYITLSIVEGIPGWLAVMVIGRDLIICLGFLVLYLTSHPLQIRPSQLSRINTIFQFATIVMVLLILYPLPFPQLIKEIGIWGTAITTIGSGVQYLSRGIRIVRQH